MATLIERITDLINEIGGDVGDKTELDTTAQTNLVDAINEVLGIAEAAAGGGVSINDTTPSLTQTYSSTKIEALDDAQDTAIALKANDNAVVKLTGAQTVAGVKTFSDAPVVPDASFTIAKTNGLQAALNAKGTLDDGAANNDATKVWSADKTYDEIVARVNTVVGGASAAYDTFAELQALMELDDTETAGIIAALALRLRLDGTAQTVSDANKLVARTTIGAQSAAEIGNPDTDLVAIYTAAKG